jgi:hypothetical protein
MARPTEFENPTDYKELAKLALWEADRTLDREAAESMRALADRFKRRSERARPLRRRCFWLFRSLEAHLTNGNSWLPQQA